MTMKWRLAVLAMVVGMMLLVQPAQAAKQAVSGSFSVSLANLQATPKGAKKCMLDADLTLSFAGDVTGQAQGPIRVLIDAACPDVFANAPGTFADTFRADLAFVGTVDGTAATSELVYKGQTAAGGTVEASMRFSNGMRGKLKAEATAGQGGSYTGELKVQ